MSKLEAIKEQFHDLIDLVDDEAVLTQYFGVMSSAVKEEVTDFWNDLSIEEQTKIPDAVKQTRDPSKLISHEESFERHAPWRIR